MSTSPRAPAEPLEAGVRLRFSHDDQTGKISVTREQVRRSLGDVLSLVKQGPGGRNVWLLPYEAEAILAALSVSAEDK